MARPSFFMVCIVKTPELRRRLLIPLPLLVLEDLLRAGLDLWKLAARFMPRLGSFADQYMSIVNSMLPELASVFSVLRHAGPITLVEVDDPDSGVMVSIRTF